MYYISDEKLLAFRIKELRKNSGKTKLEIVKDLNIELKRYNSLENGSTKLNKEEEKTIKSYYGLDESYFKKEASLQEELDIKSYRVRKENIRNVISACFIVIIACFGLIYFVFENKKTDLYELVLKDDLQYQVLENNVFGAGKVSCVKYLGDEEETHIPEYIYNNKGKKYDVVSVDLAGFKNIVYLPKSIISFRGYLNGPRVYHNWTLEVGPIQMDYPCKGVVVSEDNPMLDSRDNCNCIIEKSTNKLLFACKENSFIPDSVESIGRYAFSYRKFDELIIPGNVKNIETYAFWDTNIETLVLEEGVEVIEQYAFYGVRDVILPKSLKCLDKVEFHNVAYAYYAGSIDSVIGKYLAKYSYSNEKLCFYSETNPTNSGKFWHYVDGKPALWQE